MLDGLFFVTEEGWIVDYFSKGNGWKNGSFLMDAVYGWSMDGDKKLETNFGQHVRSTSRYDSPLCALC